MERAAFEVVRAVALARATWLVIGLVRLIPIHVRAKRKSWGVPEVLTLAELPLFLALTVYLFRLPAPMPAALGFASSATAALGAVAAVTGLLLTVWAVYTSVRAGLILDAGHYVKEHHPLVTTGAYGLVRNPMYLGVLLIWFGIALALTDTRLFVVAIAYVLPVYSLYIRAEERMMLGEFGASYERYMLSVGRLIPRLRHSSALIPH